MNPTAQLTRRRLVFSSGAALALGLLCPVVRAAAGDSTLHAIGSNDVVGSGAARTESRAVSGFQAIAITGPVKLVLRQGGREALELRGDDNLLPLIETRVVERAGFATLEIGPRRGTNLVPRIDMVVTVDVVMLRALSLSGSGDVVCDELKTPAMRLNLAGSGKVRLRQLSADATAITVSGSGDVDVAGRTGELSLSIAGSGNVNAARLVADEVTVGLAGSGDASVHARKTLAVSIAGSANVNYVGDAVVTRSIAGSGRVQGR